MKSLQDPTRPQGLRASPHPHTFSGARQFLAACRLAVQVHYFADSREIRHLITRLASAPLFL